MAYFFISLLFLSISSILKRIILSITLFASRLGIFIICVCWGVGVAICIKIFIENFEPNIVLKIIFGYMLGAFVSILSYGNNSFNEDRDNDIKTLSMFSYITQ